MLVINKIQSLQNKIHKLKQSKKKIGFVPTMGALHKGHSSLLRQAREECDVVVLSIFVNPKQFSPREDFKQYPRAFKQDKMLAQKEQVDIIFHPTADEIYPTNYLTLIKVLDITNTLCGKDRPTHFDGVTTVVGKLLNIVSPDILYLGQKDAQQAVVIRRMIGDLNFPVKVRICPTVREADGLALSSRNKYLTARQRKEATVLYRSLKAAKKKILNGTQTAAQIKSFIKSMIARESSGKIDYIACVDAQTLTPISRFKGNVMIALAIRFNKTRLIDNIVFRI